MDTISERINEIIDAFGRLAAADDVIRCIETAAQKIIVALKSGHKLLVCGNGGSAADAQHMATEFVCKFYKERAPLPALALTTDTSLMTAVSNDFSFEQVFSRQVQALGKSGDVLVGISTSGTSKNVLEALRLARDLGMTTVLLTGGIRRECAEACDIVIVAPSEDVPQIQTMHLAIEHIICEMVETAYYG